MPGDEMCAILNLMDLMDGGTPLNDFHIMSEAAGLEYDPRKGDRKCLHLHDLLLSRFNGSGMDGVLLSVLA